MLGILVDNLPEGTVTFLFSDVEGSTRLAKSLGDGVGAVTGVAGGAILGDGRVGLILDVPELLALSQLDEAPPLRLPA